MRSLAGFFLSIDQRFYDILAIILFGLAANVIIGSAGRDDEYELLCLALTCAFSGGIMMFLRSRRAAIETSANAKRLLNQQAVSTKAWLLAAGSPVPEDVKSRALAARNSRREDIRNEINIHLGMRINRALVLATFIIAISSAYFSINGLMARLYVPANSNIHEIIESTMTTSHEKVVGDIRLLREEIFSLSALLSSNSARTDENITAGQIETSKAISALRTEINTLSTSVENLETETAIPPPLNGGTENEQDRKQE